MAVNAVEDEAEQKENILSRRKIAVIIIKFELL